MGEPRAGYADAVTIRGKKWLYEALPADIAVKDLIDNTADIFKYIPPVDKGLVIGGRGGNIEGISLIAVEFGIYAV